MITRRDFIKITAATGTFASVGRVSDAQAAVRQVLPDAGFALEEERKIPVMADTDLVIAGGSSRAVAAAVAAARKGRILAMISAVRFCMTGMKRKHCKRRLRKNSFQERAIRRLCMSKKYWKMN